MKSINKKAMEDELYNLLYMLDCPENVCHKYDIDVIQYPYFMIGYIRNSILYMLDENYVYKLIHENSELKRVNAASKSE